MQTSRRAFHAIKAGEGDVFISAGVETVSRFQFGTSDHIPNTKNPLLGEAQARTAEDAKGGKDGHDPARHGPATQLRLARQIGFRSPPTNDGSLMMTRVEQDIGRAASAREPRWLDADQQKVWRAFLLGTTLLTDRIDEDLRRLHGISAVEYEILVRLSEADGQLRMARLAASLAHSRSRVTHTVKRMENAGLVQRTDSPDDGRGVIAQLTEKGATLLAEAAPDHVETVRQYLIELVDPADFAAFGRVMNAVSDKLISEHPERELRD